MITLAKIKHWFSQPLSAKATDISTLVIMISCFLGEGWLSRKRLLAGDRVFLLLFLAFLAVELGLLYLLRSASRKIDTVSSAAQLGHLRTAMGISAFSAIFLAELFSSYARVSLDAVAVLDALGVSAIVSVGLFLLTGRPAASAFGPSRQGDTGTPTRRC